MGGGVSEEAMVHGIFPVNADRGEVNDPPDSPADHGQITGSHRLMTTHGGGKSLKLS